MKNKEKKNKKKKNFLSLVPMLIFMLVGAAFGVLFAQIDNGDMGIYGNIIFFAIFILGVYLAIFFHVIVHEAGHLVFGLLSGYKFSSFRIFSFMWIKDESGKTKFKKMSITGTAGQCLMLPPEEKDGKIPVVLYNLGGSFLNIIAGLIFLVVFLACGYTYFGVAMALFALVGIATALINGIPMRLGGVDNDGYNVISISKSREAARAFQIQLKVLEQLSRGVDIRKMPAEWFEIPSDESMKNSMAATIGVFGCERLVCDERFEEADALMAHMLEIESGLIGIHRNYLVCCRIYNELIGENREDVIEKMLSDEQKKYMKAMKSNITVIRIEYAIARLYEYNDTKAEKILASFEKAAKTHPYPIEIEIERRLIEIVDQKAAQACIR